MKKIALVMLSVLCWLSGYAQLKVVEKPYFLGGETRLEVSRVSLYDDRTVVDVDYYAGAMGDAIRFPLRPPCRREASNMP